MEGIVPVVQYDFWVELKKVLLIRRFRIYDNIGLLSRDPDLLYELLALARISDGLKKVALSHVSYIVSKLDARHYLPILQPTRIIYPTDWYPLPNLNQQTMTMAFVKALENYLDIHVTELSILKEWARTSPEHLRNTSLIDYLGMVCKTS